MVRNRILVGALAVCMALPIAACSSGSSGGSGVGNSAVNAILGDLFASIRTGSQNIDPAVTNGTLSNFYEFPEGDSDFDIAVNGTTGDTGTVVEVDTSYTVETDSDDGSWSGTVEVTDANSAHTFLSATIECSKLSLSARIPSWGEQGLSPTNGTGVAYMILTASQTCDFSRKFVNENVSGETLVDLSGKDTPAENRRPDRHSDPARAEQPHGRRREPLDRQGPLHRGR
jgi:hypothetical protein